MSNAIVNLIELPHPDGWSVQPVTDDPMLGAGRVIRVAIEHRPDQVATVVTASSESSIYRVYLPDSDEYVDATIEWVPFDQPETNDA